jgi:putative MATE family efflux protein
LTPVSNKRIWRIAYPIIIGSVAQNFINVTDTAFLGQLGEIELGAAAIGGIFYLTIIMFGYGLSVGTQIIIARREGEGNHGQVGMITEHSLITLLVLSLAMFGLMRFLSPAFFSLIISSGNVLAAANDFIRLRAWGIVFAFINLGFNAFYIGTSNTRVISWSTFSMAFFNILLDYLLIFGKFGFPAMGIKGAAIASVCAEISVTVFFIWYTLKFTDLKKYLLFYFSGFETDIWIRIIRLSAPIMFQNFLSLAVWFVFFVFVEQMGETQLAVSNIVRSIYVILMIPIWGFAAASGTLVSYLIGRGRISQVLPVILRVSWLSFLMVIAFVLVILLIPGFIISIYTTDPALINASLPVLYVVSGSVVCFSFAMVFFSGLAGTGKTQVTLIIELIVVTGYLFVAYYITNVHELSIARVWMVEFLYAVALFILSFLYLKFGDWKDSSLV